MIYRESRMPEVLCFHCQKKHLFQGTLGRREECPHCKNDLHCCKNCRFFDPKAYNQCSEPIADVVKEKERANFCDHFEAGGSGKASGPTKQDLMAAAEALFKKK